MDNEIFCFILFRWEFFSMRVSFVLNKKLKQITLCITYVKRELNTYLTLLDSKLLGAGLGLCLILFDLIQPSPLIILFVWQVKERFWFLIKRSSRFIIDIYTVFKLAHPGPVMNYDRAENCTYESLQPFCTQTYISHNVHY